jgi:hypothetical protein
MPWTAPPRARECHSDEIQPWLICRLSSADGKWLAFADTGGFDPFVWSGRALQEFESIRQLRSCINVSGLCLERVVLRAIMDISAHAISSADRPRPGHSGHQCSHAPGRPILHRRLILSQTSAGRLNYIIDSSSFVLFLCSCLAAVPSSRPARADAPRGRSCQGWPSRGPCPSLPCYQATA